MSLQSRTPALKENIQVFLKVRPVNEEQEKTENIFELRGNQVIVRRDRTNGSQTKTFTFNGVFSPASKQIDVFKTVAQPLIAEVLKGINASILVYGQTGTGKSFTMVGDRTPGDGNSWDKDPLAGLAPRVIGHLFAETSNVEFSMVVTFLEIINEELHDLLAHEVAENSSQLKIFDTKNSVIVQGLTEIRVFNKIDALNLLKQGFKKRKTAPTNMNATSSRSHAILAITVSIRESNEAGEDLIRTGKITLVDLAGSENISRSGSTKQQAREAGSINKSMLTLGRIINMLGQTTATQSIPYRDANLTRLLKDSLGGNSKTCFVATVSALAKDAEETLSTLNYASSAMKIVNQPASHYISKEKFLRRYDEMVERLRKDLVAQRSGQGLCIDKEVYLDTMEKLEIQEHKIKTLEEEKMQRETYLKEVIRELEDTNLALLHTRNTLKSLDREILILQEALSSERVLRDVHEKAASADSGIIECTQQQIEMNGAPDALLADGKEKTTKISVSETEQENLDQGGDLEKNPELQQQAATNLLIEEKTTAEKSPRAPYMNFKQNMIFISTYINFKCPAFESLTAAAKAERMQPVLHSKLLLMDLNAIENKIRNLKRTFIKMEEKQAKHEEDSEEEPPEPRLFSALKVMLNEAEENENLKTVEKTLVKDTLCETEMHKKQQMGKLEDKAKEESELVSQRVNGTSKNEPGQKPLQAFITNLAIYVMLVVFGMLVQFLLAKSGPF